MKTINTCGLKKSAPYLELCQIGFLFCLISGLMALLTVSVMPSHFPEKEMMMV